MHLIFKMSLLSLIMVSIFAHAAPDWFLNTHQDPKVVTGTGFGEDLETARQQAIKSLSLSLYSEISSYTEQGIETEGTVAQAYSKATMKIENQHVSLGIVKWVKQDYVDELYYVKADMNLAEWIQAQETKLQAHITIMDGMVSLKQWSLSDYRRSQEIAMQEHQAVAEMIAPYSMMSAIFNTSAATLIEKQNQFANSVCFTVQPSNNKVADKYFLPVIESALYYSHLTVADQPECRKVTFIARNEKLSSTKLRSRLLINVDGESSYQVEMDGSGSSYRSALVSVANNLSDYFVEQGGILPSIQ